MSSPFVTALTLPFWDFVSGMVALGATGGGAFAFFRWLLGLATARVTAREKRVDDTSDKLFDNAMGFAKAMEGWGTRLQREVDETKAESRRNAEELEHCRASHAHCTEEMATLRAQLGLKGVIAQEAQKAIAQDRLADRERRD